ncbi:MAG: CotH kinase family protein, partial [Sedimentisphaerales bacterium]|nr:CotH kinase family protein [Sedimentisphaerales bacterium]
MNRLAVTYAWAVCVILCAGGVLAANPIVSEFLASNEAGLRDQDGDTPDWVEIHNPTEDLIDLDGWYLTDDVNDLEKWEFPAVQLPPGGYMLVFASGKNRRDPDGELHANFSLRAGGESLLLVEPDGATVAHGYPEYAPQFVDLSYGLSSDSTISQTQTVLVPEGADARALIPPDGSLGSSWRAVGFSDTNWLSGRTGVGYDYGGLVNLDVAAMRNVNRTVYIRIPFAVTQAAEADKLILRMRYEDGFVAYLNGLEVARSNAPEAAQLTWNAGATATRDDGDAVSVQEFDITAYKDLLINGDNLLAIHGLNTTVGSSDLLVLPELVAVEVERIDLTEVTEGYLLQPTPGAANQAALAQIGPAIRNVTEDPPAPAPGEDVVVTAEVSETLAPISDVKLLWRINGMTDSRWLPTDGLPMVDDGAGADATAGDGVYTGVIPSDVLTPGDMVCWAVRAEDAEGNASRDPLFPYRYNSPEYYGTVVQDPTIDTALPVFHWCVENVSASETDSGTRGSVYYLGEFYDNVVVHRRGGSTAGAPKKHFKFRFNRGYSFRYRDDAPRVNEINLNSTYSDKAYLRQNLAFEAYDWCGCPGSESFPVRAQRNREFYGVQVFIEEPEEELLEREGLDPDGALYKMYNTFNTGGGAEKKTRRWEGRGDLDDFCRAINNTSGTTLHNNIFDYVNLPLTLNYLVGTILTHQNDHPHKNHYLYRDSDGSGQWCFLPWDHDLTWGSNWTGNSYHDYIYAADDRVAGKPTTVKPSHPFVGKQDCQEWNYHWNHLIDALLNDSTVRQMYLRRLRTVMDDFLKPPGTPYAELFIENRIDELVTAMAPDVLLDYSKWANPWSWGGQGGYPRDQSLAYAVNVLKEDYLAVRRTHLFVTHNVDNVAGYNISGSYSAAIPNAQPADATIQFGTYEYNPISGNQDEEYIELVNPNAYAVDISGWQLTGGVEHAFVPGTVIAAGERLYVSPSVRAFRGRTTSPTGGQGRYIQGNYDGHLSSWGEIVDLTDRYGRLVDSLSCVGVPSDQQQSLRITELMYNPLAGGDLDNDEYEFIELMNIGTAPVILDGVKLTD